VPAAAIHVLYCLQWSLSGSPVLLFCLWEEVLSMPVYHTCHYVPLCHMPLLMPPASVLPHCLGTHGLPCLQCPAATSYIPASACFSL